MYSEWPSFCSYFTSFIIDDASLPDLAKLHYLKGCLKGEPALLLQRIPVTDSNFQKAWEKLRGNYENKRRLIRSQLVTFTSIPSATEESAE
ncbi:hypothetical protein WN55_09817 [Dufourea novaeangliae]|uniref:Uncharacterized protein n=1 Tax=Dufourea novaeangliae TaxID=178035 RepID=A0A154P7G9_DUFNO|nr:hypothetical protein WN55_09817 [Dufourea novaeangliae]